VDTRQIQSVAAIAVSALALLGAAVSYGVLQSTVSTNNDEITKLRGSIDALRLELTEPSVTLREQLAKLREDVRELQSTADKHEKAIDKLSYSAAALAQQLALLQGSLGETPAFPTTSPGAPP
jgi:predicted  nucleic acid-binding Zn-ribbon protein